VPADRSSRLCCAARFGRSMLVGVMQRSGALASTPIGWLRRAGQTRPTLRVAPPKIVGPGLIRLLLALWPILRWLVSSQLRAELRCCGRPQV
jgi:hypothetical protein